MQQAVSDLWGLEASHHEYSQGDRVRFLADGKALEGEIIWICAPALIAGHQVPMQYVVEVDDQAESFPAMITQGNIVQG